ncbi:phenylalanine--tRNA ligase subunit beta [Ectothiorhodospiraceae bacterium 2226]|nr:phenylalanine--tRNA ligase subunit beta [Ectothiorhodospiraceae bacterium 2226]
MRFSERWLREWVDAPVSTQELCAQLTMAGLEVEGVERAAPGFEGVVVGRVLEVAAHPDADKLRVCQVDVGGAELLTIVCGAPNVAPEMRVPTAVVGARLPDGLKIRKTKLRGVPSAGMLCSAKELGLAEQSEGLMSLPADATPGTDVREVLDLDDVCIELSLTPNRGDCLSVAGIAREVAVLNDMSFPGVRAQPVAPAVDDTFPVTVAAPQACPRYVGRVVRDVDPRAVSPLWLRERLRRSGLRSINPVVDVTNYVLLECGQPMHGFDLARLRGGICVRRAHAGERLTLLDGREIELAEDCLVIADEGGPLALAGVMGGEESGVTPDTCDVFLESAFFSPQAIAGRARRYGLHTDSSHRFERGVDPTLQRVAVERATALLIEIAGGRAGPVVEVEDARELPARAPIPLRPARVQRVLGTEIATDRSAALLGRLGLDVAREDEVWQVTPPSFRFDLEIEEDLIEEIARIHGYDRIPSKRPRAELAIRPRPEARLEASRLRGVLTARDYQEVITYSFVEPGLQALLTSGERAVPLANPISADLAEMRTSLWPGLVQVLSHNLKRQQTRLRVFEVGLKFAEQSGGEIVQAPRLGLAACGPALPEQWGADPRELDFFDLKGDLEALLALGGAGQAYRFVAATHPALHPGQSARIERAGEPVGWIGALHPAVVRRLDLRGRVLLAEISLDALISGKVPQYAPVSRFPAMRRDLALVVDEGVSAQALTESVERSAPAELKNFQLFDVYGGKGVDSGRKSVAVGLTFQDPSRTLTDQDVDAFIAQVLKALQQDLGATLRE